MHHARDRTILKIDGVDSGHFLQKILSNDISQCSEKAWVYSLILNPQGKVMADCFIINQAQQYFLDIPHSQSNNIVKLFLLYKLKADVNLLLETKMEVWYCAHNQDFKDPRHSDLGSRILKDSSTDNDNAEAAILYHQKRMMLRIVDYEYDLIPKKYFAFDLEMDRIHAISYSKGCYVGQEVTTRTHNRIEKRSIILPFSINNGEYQRFLSIHFKGRIIGEMLGYIKEINLGLGMFRISETPDIIGEIAIINNQELINAQS